MNKIKARQEELRNLLSFTEKLSTEYLADYFGVTPATVRADIREMEDNGEVYRSKGFVSLLRPFVADKTTKEKIFVNAELKHRIGNCAAQMIKTDDFVLMTSGTTIEAMASHVEPKGRLEVVTPSIGVAVILAQKENVDVNMLGGKIQTTSMSVRDSYSLKGLEGIFCSKLFISCDGFDLAAGVFTATIEEARLSRALIEASRQVILLADSTKLGKVGLGHICNFSDVDIMITDSDIPEKTREALEASGVHVVIS